MVGTRGRASPKKTLEESETVEEKPKLKSSKVEEDSSSDSDSSSDGELDDLVSQTLKEFSAASDDGSSSESDSESGSDESDGENSDNNSPQECFIVDKLPGKERKLLRTKGPTSLKTGSTLNDNEGNGKKNKTSNQSEPSTGNPAKRYEPVTALDPGIDMDDIYVNLNSFEDPQPSKRIATGHSAKNLLKGSVIDSEFEKKHTVPPYEESLNQLKKQRRAERAKTTGKGWFDVRAQEMTEQKKNDLMVLQMRRVLDPKRFYKAPDTRALPKFFQMGRVVEGPADFYHSRIPKKQRKATLVDELMADAEFRKYNKRKYAELVEQKKVPGAYKHMKRMKKRKR